jgi:hypothetical protein
MCMAPALAWRCPRRQQRPRLILASQHPHAAKMGMSMIARGAEVAEEP